jgi:hypothetical protein
MPDDLSDDVADDELSLEDLDELADQIAPELEVAADLAERVAFLSIEKMPCPECAGAGAISGGSLGDICPGCNGRRVVEHPGAAPVDLPSLAPWRDFLRNLDAYKHDQALLANSGGEGFDKPKGLHAPGRPPTLEDLQAVIADLRGRGERLSAAGAQMPALPTPKAPKSQQLLGSMSHDETSLGEDGSGPTDEDLDSLEDQLDDD